MSKKGKHTVSALERIHARQADAHLWSYGREETRRDPLLENEQELIWGEPVKKEDIMSFRTIWTTICGNYRVVRSENKYDTTLSGFTAWAKNFSELRTDNQGNLFGNGKVEISVFERSIANDRLGRPRIFRTLEEAFGAIVTHHTEKTGKEIIKENAEEVLTSAIQHGLDQRPKGEEAPKEDKPARPKVSREPRAEVEKDRFGMRLGTRAAAINAVLTEQWQTLTELTERSKATSVSGHLKKLIELGHLVESKKDGTKKYKLVKEGQ